jgi:hypothetical protein
MTQHKHASIKFGYNYLVNHIVSIAVRHNVSFHEAFDYILDHFELDSILTTLEKADKTVEDLKTDCENDYVWKKECTITQ